MQVPKTESRLHNLVFVLVAAVRMHSSLRSGRWKMYGPGKTETSKAFDSISPAGLVNAMSRFGIPYHFCSVVLGIYNGRHFMVRDGDVTSRQHPKCFGISQGCPFSPFPFPIVMTLLIQDAKAAFLSRRDPARESRSSLHAPGEPVLGRRHKCENEQGKSAN